MKISLATIVGIPGCGKSTAMKMLQETRLLDEHLKGIRICYVLEPSDEWKQKGWLDQFYSNPDQNAFSFQINVFYSHVEAIERALERTKSLYPDAEHILVLVERSILCQMLFWKLQIELDRNSAAPTMANDAYMKTWERWTKFIPPIDHVFFFKTRDIQTCLDRLQQREGTQSAGPTLEYERSLYEKHLEWYSEPKTNDPMGMQIPCTHIGSDLPYHNDPDAQRTLVGQISRALERVYSKK